MELLHCPSDSNACTCDMCITQVVFAAPEITFREWMAAKFTNPKNSKSVDEVNKQLSVKAEYKPQRVEKGDIYLVPSLDDKAESGSTNPGKMRATMQGVLCKRDVLTSSFVFLSAIACMWLYTGDEPKNTYAEFTYRLSMNGELVSG